MDELYRNYRMLLGLGQAWQMYIRGKNFVPIMTDIWSSMVLEVVDWRTVKSADLIWKTLPEQQQSKLRLLLWIWQHSHKQNISATKNAPRES